MDNPLRAVIYIAAHLSENEVGRWLKSCVDYCAARGYEIADIVLDRHGGAAWADVLTAVTGGADAEAHVIVVAHRDHLPRNRIPRLEVASEWRDPHRDDPGRPHFLGHLH